MSWYCKTWINGQAVETDGQRLLIDVLRNDLGLKSVKDGCSEGACGACTVLIDGVPVKACVQTIKRVEGKQILTVEGLSREEKEIYVKAFADAGAVQCGFCIPGMVMRAKGLLDKNPNPTRAEAAYAIRGSYCRCTGYKKIIDAILLAGKLLRGEAEEESDPEPVRVGSRMRRIDAREKILGTGKYVDDLDRTDIPGMIYAGAVRSHYPRAVVKAIHTEKAKALPGVVCVLTAEDIPGQNKVGHLKTDWDTMIPVGETTRFLGDAICIVAAETEEILEEARFLIEVEYEELKPLTSPAEALAEGAPLIHPTGNILSHEHLVRGNADEVIANSRYKVTRHYETPWTEHAFLEPECAVAMPFDDGVLIYSGDQSAYDTRRETALMLGIPQEKVIVETMLVGGGFGGKEDVTVQHHAALVAYRTKRPVKVKLTRKESLLIHPKRHSMSIDMTTACDENGRLTAMKAVVVSDTGAYASLGGPVLQRACTHAAGPYNYQVIDIEGTAVYTNNPPAGAFRGFGVAQTCFATEMNLNLLAQMCKMTPWQFRYLNAIRPGDVLPNGQIADPSTGLAETLEAVRELYESEPYVGIACAMKNAGVGIGLPDTGRVRLIVQDGKVQIHSAASCMGQGVGTVLVQMIAEKVGISPEQIEYHRPNTSVAPDSGTSSGSRQTLVTGEAAVRAARKLRRALFEATGREYRAVSRCSVYPEGIEVEEESEETAAVTFTGEEIARLNGREFYAEYLAKTDRMGAPVEHPVSHVAYGYATQLCILNEDGRIKKMVGAHDVGRAVNPKSVEGQIEGGIVMGCGYALTEQYPLKNCVPGARFGTLGLFRADETPEIESIIIEKPGVDVACGAIGVGEITTIPTAPAIAGAYAKLTGEPETRLPLRNTPYAKKKLT